VGCRSSREVPLPGGIARAQKACSLLSAGLIILAVIGLTGSAMAAESLCEPGSVRRPRINPHAIPAVASNPGMTVRVVTIQWLGHSSFLIVTSGGTTALTDPHPRHASPTVPDIVTISNEHPTHNHARSAPGSPRCCVGRRPMGNGSRSTSPSAILLLMACQAPVAMPSTSRCRILFSSFARKASASYIWAISGGY
jgi:Beta-lactamase superfamily domain